MMDLFISNMQLFTITLMTWWTRLVDYCDVFIRHLNSHSGGTHSLQRIHWWAGDIMLNLSHEETTLDDLQVKNIQHSLFGGYTIKCHVRIFLLKIVKKKKKTVLWLKA